MIKALYGLGKIYELSESSEFEFENPNKNGRYNNIIILEFTIKDSAIKDFKVSLEEFSKDKLNKYFYFKGQPNGGDLTPTTRISEVDNPLKKFIKPLKKLKFSVFEKVLEYINLNYNDITKQITSHYKAKEGYILTIKINDKWVGECEDIVNQIKSKPNEAFYHRESIGTSKANDKICFCCRKQKEQVYGFVNTYNFYTVNLKGFVAGGFNQEQAWKNYPICPECASTLENGKNFLEMNFSGKFAEKTYLTIPKPIFDLYTNEDVLEYTDLIFELINNNKISLSEGRKEGLFGNEIISTEIMAQMKNSLVYNIMFYNDKNSAFKIVLNIEDVTSSRLTQLFLVKEEVEKSLLYKNQKCKDKKTNKIEYRDLFCNFQTIREFFPFYKDKKIGTNLFWK